MPEFKDVLVDALRNKLRVDKWFFVSFRNEDTGAFSYAAIVEDENSIKAVGQAYKICETDIPDAMSNYAELPITKLPDDSYRNRKLTRAEVETLWPEDSK